LTCLICKITVIITKLMQNKHSSSSSERTSICPMLSQSLLPRALPAHMAVVPMAVPPAVCCPRPCRRAQSRFLYLQVYYAAEVPDHVETRRRRRRRRVQRYVGPPEQARPRRLLLPVERRGPGRSGQVRSGQEYYSAELDLV
jgi:hypothetical protein